MAVASTVFSVRGMMTRPLGMVSISVSHLKCFYGIWLWTSYLSKLLVLWSRNYVASATLNLVCNNLFELRCMWAVASYLWNIVTGDVLCWIMYDLGLFIGWFEILRDFMDYRDYMCSNVKIWSLRRLFLYLCSYNLDGSVIARICSACQAKKQVGVPYPPKSIMTTTQPLELIHMDLFGPVAYLSLKGNKYGLIIVDDYSRFT
jgi:hypothetical protein